ncbi:type II CRISPR RNA-guided endonuclease Cas9 [Lactococcus nasutitermitis]|uniref:CRISPR-associated endonuclease Cas9 n=1 Tax=Lactococcus nasutitermitis TaxID=1652957 RepID=A0ABV9JDM5_9LACT|nr:type II CRISPR RNA-guided endonuclease Cas9 [Lactococcus nasutitermitis]
MAKYSVGLDIGIASCGWSIIDIDKKEIVDLGSRIFPSGNAAGNQDRRSFRGTRRLIRRRKNRLSDLTKFLEILDKSVKFDEKANPYELRVKGLTEKLSKAEIASALLHIVKRRGISYDLGDLEDDGTSGVSDYKSSININRQLLKEKTVGQIQLGRLSEFGQVRGQVKVDDEKTLLNVFPASAYADEAERILTKQQEFYPEITDEFIEKICKKDDENPENNGLIVRKREYFTGPGNEKSHTDYGVYKTSQYVKLHPAADYKENGKTLKNLFSELIGIDIQGEKRASASSLTAQIYNLLNDLNNLKAKEPNENTDSDGKLTTETKEKILYALRNNSGKNQLSINQICKFMGAKSEDIDGFRVKNDDSKTKQLHNLKAYDKFRKALAEIGKEANDLPTEFFDKIADILTLNTEKSEIRKQLDKAEFADISDEIKELIIEQNKNLLVDGRATWHSFSYSTMKKMYDYQLNTSHEQMTILTHDLKLMKPDNEKYKGLKNIPAKKITEEIYNPVVAKSTREAINVFNAIAKRLGRENIEQVIIELPREDNEDDVRKNIQKFQKEQENEKHTADEAVKQQMTISDSELRAQYRRYKGLSQKVRFWYQQENICPYCGKKIEAVQLINNNDSFEVDHIIPISVSFDDSQNNKVLVHAQCNQAKAQQTPLGWINNGGGFGQDKSIYIAKIKANKRYSKNKIDNLLNNADLNDIETRRGFVQRNINDTRYASRTVLDEFYSFFKSNNLPTKVKVVRGKWTSQMRKKWNGAGGLAKTRDTHHHHAIDASIIASFPLLKAFDRVTLINEVDEDTGEILKKIPIVSSRAYEKEISELYDFPLFKQVERANDIGNFSDTEIDKDGKKKFIEDPEKIADNPVKFSHKVDKKANRAVANQTIYGTRMRETEIIKRGKTEISQDEYVFGTIKDIYNVDDFAKFKKLYDEAKKKDELKFLMQVKDTKTWEKLEKILKEYPDFEEKTQVDGKVKIMPASPFELYRRDNGFITKYAKHNNGPKVVSLKYYDTKVGNHIDITPSEAKNKVLLQSLKPWRTDVYFNPETGLYELLGLKYADLKYTKGVYGITQEAYNNLKLGRTIKKDETIITAGKPAINSKSEFCFSLYRNDQVKVEKDDESYELRFISITEMKPLHMEKFIPNSEIPVYGNVGKEGRLRKLVVNGAKLYKINTDILGTLYPIEKEELKLTI